MEIMREGEMQSLGERWRDGDKRIKEKLGRYMGAVDIVDADIKELDGGEEASDSDETDSAD